MRDGALRRTIKKVALLGFRLDLAVSRALRRWRREPAHRLAGACRRSGLCCETPAIQAGRLVWYLASLRFLFLRWHRHVNGFVLLRRERPRTFVFRCTHFDPATRSCDSYGSRPGMCRDYPRALLEQPSPALLAGCGYRALAPRAEGLGRALAGLGLEAERERELRRRLQIE